jgi:DNA-binding transcriptional ArsR family regulator
MSQLESNMRSPPSRSSGDSRVLSIEAAGTTGVFDCLSSATAREMVALLHEEPRTASELAEFLDTSLQNFKYHLGKFQNAYLVEVVDTEYSARGVEMDVYAPTDEALVLHGCQPGPSENSLRDLLRGVLGTLSLLAILSLVVEATAPVLVRPLFPGDTAPGTAGGWMPEPLLVHIAGVSISAGLLFFAAGAFVLTVVLAAAVWTDRLPLRTAGGWAH